VIRLLCTNEDLLGREVWRALGAYERRQRGKSRYAQGQ